MATGERRELSRTTKRLVTIGGLLVAGVAVAVVLFVPGAPGSRTVAAAPTKGSASSPPRTPRPPSESLASPESALDTQVNSILGGHLTAFRATLLPEVAPDLTPSVWRACVSRIHKQPVNATWSDSLDGQADGGERVRRVTVLGGVQVGFHERGGRWFADGIWCAAQ